LRKDNGLNNQDTTDFLGSRTLISDPFSNQPDPVAHFAEALASIANSKAFPGQPHGQPGVSRKETESTDGVVRRSQLEDKR
jgi:hypothetical protein